MKNSCFFVKLPIKFFNKNSIVGEKFTDFMLWFVVETACSSLF